MSDLLLNNSTKDDINFYMINYKHSKLLFFISILFISLLTLSIEPSFGVDEENCILCHKHKYLRTADKNGKIKSFYVNNEDFKGSMHKRVICRGCHTNITEVPHKKSYKKVNCGIACHSKSISLRGFTHSKIYDSFMTGAHGTPSEDTPDCLYCHPKNTAKNKKNRLEILAECSVCHMDNELMKKYGIIPDTVDSYKNSAHGKVFFLEQNSSATCTDCHSTHNISSSEIETSSINEKVLYETCAGKQTPANIKGCHLVTNPDFIFAFKHEKDKEAGVATALKLKDFINYLILGIFYLFCIVNILKIIRN
jgi:hypothetical protein